MLELDDIQSGVLSPRPTPYAAMYILLRIDNPGAGRILMRRLSKVVSSAAHTTSPAGDTWVSASLSFHGLLALGVPQRSLDSFAWEFRQGMVARAAVLGDTGENGPEHWESPLGTSDVHVVVTALAPDAERLATALLRVDEALRGMPGIEAIWLQDCYSPSTGREHFGYKDNISQPTVGDKAGEFVLGYADEMSDTPAMPWPEVLGRNGTYVVFRKLHQRVAAFRRYLKENASDRESEELLAAKMLGRWRSGAPLGLCPVHDDPELGADPLRNNDFLYGDDPTGYKTPLGAHIRRAHPRDSAVAGIVGLHRMIRRGTVYGPELPEGVLEDDGVDRGFMFAFIGAHIGRQFEFVQSEWIDRGDAFGLGAAKDPLVGANDGTGSFSIPRRPLPRVLRGLPQFVVVRGGEYCFMPGLRALRWLAELRT